MTAVNAFLETDCVHIFSDGGYFSEEGQIAAIGGKVLALPRFNAVLIVSGPSAAGPRLLAHIERREIATLSQLVQVLPDMLGSAGLAGVPFTVIAVGVENGWAHGVAIEETGKVHALAPGSVVKSLTCDGSFDLDDIERSAIVMMEEQRARHGFVGGFCQETTIDSAGLRSRVLTSWPDRVSGLVMPSRAAKIANLTVDTINIANNAVLAVATSTTSVFVPNVLSLPVKLFGSARSRYRNSGSAGTVTYSIAIARSYDGKVLDIITYSRAGSSGVATTIYDYPILAAVDGASSAGVTYALSLSAVITTPGAGISDYGWDTQSIQALYRKS